MICSMFLRIQNPTYCFFGLLQFRSQLYHATKSMAQTLKRGYSERLIMIGSPLLYNNQWLMRLLCLKTSFKNEVSYEEAQSEATQRGKFCDQV